MVAVITEDQYFLVKNSSLNGLIFNPIKDMDNNWVISKNEVAFLKAMKEVGECPDDLIFICDLKFTTYKRVNTLK